MLARAFAVAIAAAALAGPAAGQECPAPPSRACVLDLALRTAQAIKDDGARAV